jgi:hypothetical protein
MRHGPAIDRPQAAGVSKCFLIALPVMTGVSGKVHSRPDRGRERAADDRADPTTPGPTRTAESERYEHTRGAVERTNCGIVLLADEERHATVIAWLVRRGLPTASFGHQAAAQLQALVH